jgi:hypothetical protein
MHVDESKKFDKRNIERNIKNGIITQKDYEIYLSKLPDVSDKLFNPEVALVDSDGFELEREGEIQPKKKPGKKKSKGKGKGKGKGKSKGK